MGIPRGCPPRGLTSGITDIPPDFAEDDEIDPDRLAECAYWRCGEIFEQRSASHRFCRKACRSRQHKWERAQERRGNRS